MPPTPLVESVEDNYISMTSAPSTTISNPADKTLLGVSVESAIINVLKTIEVGCDKKISGLNLFVNKSNLTDLQLFHLQNSSPTLLHTSSSPSATAPSNPENHFQSTPSFDSRTLFYQLRTLKLSPF